jgi:hypothetical protein
MIAAAESGGAEGMAETNAQSHSAKTQERFSINPSGSF